MPPMMRSGTGAAKGQTLDQRVDDDDEVFYPEVQRLDLGRMRAAFCVATDEACARLGWKKEAIAAALAVDPSYFTKLRTGEKPLALRHVADLPDDIEAIYAKVYAESFGLIVVTPLSTREQAMLQFVAGVVGLFRHGGDR